MASRKVRYRRESLSEVNMTNLIDVCMTLLVVFILVSNFAQNSLRITLPQVRYVETTGKEKLVIEINAKGDITLNGKIITPDILPDQLSELHSQFPEEGLFIRADELASYGRVLDVISVARQTGFKDVNLPARLAHQNQ